MPQKVIGVASGEAHTLALTGDGGVFAWGRGTFGRLGTGDEADVLAPVAVAGEGGSGAPGDAAAAPRLPKFVAVAAGSYHSLALEDDGSLWSWGYNIYGQLGYGEENSLFPNLVERFQELSSPFKAQQTSTNHRTSFKICSVKAGGMMSFAIDNLGALWMWGNCPQQTDTGEFRLASCPSPMPVWDFHGHTVVKVACGNEHIVAAVSAGETYAGGDLVCYSWGNNNHGQLGLGDNRSRSRPTVITQFNEESSWEVYDIACGSHHTAILTHKKSYDQELESRCWTFGLNDNGQLGHGTTTSINFPEPVKGLPRDAFLISLDCGLFHTAVVSSDGEVWCWGMEKGLGLCPDASFSETDAGDALYPLRVHAPGESKFSGPVQIACGAAHTVLVAANGYKMWAWGRGRSGVLGRGRVDDSYVPCSVSWPPRYDGIKKAETTTAREVMVTERERAGSRREIEKSMKEMEMKLSLAADEQQMLRAKLAAMERYANTLHISIFRKPLDEHRVPKLVQDSEAYDVRKEFEQVLDDADNDELRRLEMFYRGLLVTVKDKLMRRRVHEMVRECLRSASGRRPSSSS